MTVAASVAVLLQHAGHDPLVQALAIILGTFILEDAATIVAAAETAAGHVSPPLALCSLYIGIVAGDLGLYGLGRLASTLPWARRIIPPPARQAAREWVGVHLLRVVFISRFLPGARLPSYTSCGFVGADFTRFALAAMAATLIWTSFLFGVSLRLGGFLAEHLGAWRWLGVAGVVVGMVLIGRAAARLQAATR